MIFRVVVDVVQEGVQRRDALLHPGFEVRPFRGGEHARDAVERQDAVDRAGLGIDGEGDAEIDQVVLGRRGARAQCIEADGADRRPHAARLRRRRPSRSGASSQK